MHTQTNFQTSYVKRPFSLIYILLVSFLFTYLPSNAQTVQQVIIGPTAGTGSFAYGPIYRNTGNAGLLNYSRHAYIYTNTELNIPAGAKIISLEWLKKDTARILGNNTFNVWMANSANTAFSGSTAWSTLINGAFQVYGSTVYSVSGGANAYVSAPFTDSFTYNGGSLQIMTDWSKLGYATATVPFYVVGATGKAIGLASSSALTASSLLQSANYGNSRPTLRITYVTMPSCSGTPAPGNTLATVSSICPSISFTLSLQNSTPGAQVTFQWQSADNLSFTTNLTTNLGTSSTLTLTQTSNKYYRCLVTCGAGPATGVSTPIYIPMSASYSCYCSSTAQSNADEDIYKFTFGSLKNCSDCSSLASGQYSVQNLYSNYQSIAPPTILKSSVVPFSIEVGVCGTGTTYPNRCAIFIDYNQNNSFADPGELVYSSALGSNGAHTESGSIVIPTSALTGLTGLRVINSEQGYAITNPCLIYPWGETEDYVINIAAASTCSGAPVPGNTVISISGSCTSISSVYSVCLGKSVDLSIQNLTSGTGVTYQWFNNGIAIAGATLPVYTTPAITSPQSYYCNVTCILSGLTTASSPINISLQSFLNCYCSSSAANPADEDILSFSLNGMTSSSDCTIPASGTGSVLNEYSNFTTIGNLTTATIGSSIPFSIMVDDCDIPAAPYYSFGGSIWIDFNHNGSFNDIGEQVFIEAAAALSPRTIYGNIAIPCTALPGQTRLRVTAAEGLSGSNITSCLSYGFGETEDYLINLAPPVLCSNPVPSPGNTESNISLLCDSTNVLLSLQNKCLLSNYAYQWYKNGVAIPGATNNSYTTPKIFSNITYYCSVTCGTSTATSTPLTIIKSAISNVTLTASSNNYCPTGSTPVTLTASSSSTLTYTYNPTTSLSPTSGSVVSATPTSNTVYTVTGTDANGCTRTSLSSIQIISCTGSLNVKVYIQGYYLSGGLMAAVLNNQGIGSNLNLTDSIDVLLRQSSSPYSIVVSKRVALNTNGTAVVSIPTLTGNYYIVIKHRNSLETWSATPVSATIGSYDFTTNANKAYGSNMILVDTGKWGLFSGDLNGDNNIDLLDMNILGNDVTNFANGYQNSDINGDGNVDLIDTFQVENNVSNFIFSNHP